MSNTKYILLLLIVLLGSSRLVYAEQPPLQFDPPTWDVGEVELGQYFTKEIKVRATDSTDYKDSSKTGQPIKTTDSEPKDYTEITNVRPTCECLFATVISDKVNSDSGGVISATLHTDNTLSAHFRVFFYVHFSDAKSSQQFAKFYITGRVKGKGLPPSEIVIFHTARAKDWATVKQRLDVVKAKNPALVIKEYEAKDIDSYRIRARFEKQFSVSKYADVEMFTAGGAFIGVDDILKELDRIKSLGNTVTSAAVEQTGSSGQAAVTDDKPAAKDALAPISGTACGLEIFYFYSIGCGGCIEIEGTLFPKLKQRFGDRIFVNHLDIGEIKNYMRLIDMEAKYKIKANAPVSVFVGDTALLGSKEILGKTEAALESQLLTANGKLLIADNMGEGAVTGTAQAKIQERFLSFKVWAVIGAGLLDGINPCAFATIIFFISFLTFAGRSRSEIILVGVFYTLTVFVVYLLLGVGVFRVFQALAVYKIISRIILYLTAMLVFCLGVLSSYDLFNYIRTRKSSGITLQLPMSLKQRIHSVIRANLEPGRLIIGTVIIGFLVTLFEAVCTGQVYLPTIVFMLKDSELKSDASLYLVLYNLMFVIPLIGVFILAYFGLSSERFNALAKKNIILSKSLMVLLFMGLGILLLMM